MASQIKLYIKRLLETYIIGTRWNEYRWGTMHKGTPRDVEEFWDSRAHPHRSLLIERISRYHPSSVLEVGSHCGPNLYLLAQKFPHAKLVGTDINRQAVRAGRKFFREAEMANVKLQVKKADELDTFGDASFDVVMTDAVLIYVGPDKIMKAASDLVRIAKRAVILVEWQTAPGENDPEGLGVYYGSRWKRDYKNLFSQFMPEGKITSTKLSKEIWPDNNWSTLGAIIEIIK